MFVLVEDAARTRGVDVLPPPRGPLSRHIAGLLSGASSMAVPVYATEGAHAEPDDDDFQLALWMLNVSQVASFADVDPDRAASLSISTLHWFLRHSYEERLRVRFPGPASGPLAARIDEVRARPAVSRTVCGRAEVLAAFGAKAPYLAWEADPHTMALACIERPLKSSVAEIQAGEYGVGHGDVHATIYRRCLDALGHDLVDVLAEAPAEAYAVANAAWLFGTDRRLRGAALGQLALFETDSVAPCRQAIDAWDRCGLPAAGRRWYDVHVMADEVHDRVIRDQLLPTLEEQTPRLVADAHFGVTVSAGLDDLLAARLRPHKRRPAQTPCQAVSR